MSLIAWASVQYRLHGVAVYREGERVWYVGAGYREKDRAEAVDGVLPRQDVDGYGSCVSLFSRCIMVICLSERHSAKIKDTESNKTNIAVHRRYLNDNFQYQLRMEHLNYLAEVARDVKPDVAEYEIDDNIPINPSTGLPQFPPFGMESLGSRTFIKYRLIKLLKSDLWHHLIENRLLLKFMVSRRFVVLNRVLTIILGIHAGLHRTNASSVPTAHRGFQA
jgi:hypothetical protein